MFPGLEKVYVLCTVNLPISRSRVTCSLTVLFVSSAFDECIKKFRVYKVETIGDSYVVASGLPLRIGDQHAHEMAHMALHLLAISTRFSLPGHSSERLPLRIGINCGKRNRASAVSGSKLLQQS